jgi:uncharacterized protein YnzC (UPF0291/DUF896 family)
MVSPPNQAELAARVRDRLARLDDAALWNACGATIPASQWERLVELHDCEQERPLTAAEQTEQQSLLQLYQETILIRAQASVLLKLRGHDVVEG